MNIEMLNRGEAGSKILMRCISGSNAYGTNLPTSDIDHRGIFSLPKSAYLTLTEPPTQVSCEKQDETLYSLKRFFQLAMDVNPNIVELLHVPQDCLLTTSPAYEHLRKNASLFLSRKAIHTFSGYAYAQIKKSTGQNKRVMNPQPETPPKKIDFCYLMTNTSDGMPFRPTPIPASEDLQEFHVAAVERIPNTFRLYYYGKGSKGVFRGENEQLVCESIPMEDEQRRFAGIMTFNEHEYEKALKEWNQYWEWMRLRNPNRWKDQESGKTTYDCKNIMHCFRLLYSAKSILEGNGVVVRVPEPYRSFLMDIRNGKFEHDYLMEKVEIEMEALKVLEKTSPLPHSNNAELVEKLYNETCELAWQ